MKKLLLFISIFIVGYSLKAVDISGFNNIDQNEKFTFLAEDEKDYSLFIRYINNENKRLEKIFHKKIEHNKIYIYSNHKSVSKKVFYSDETSPYSGFADIHNKIVYITSPYDPYKYKTFIDYFNTPVHELVHQYFSPEKVWIREGLAHYLSSLYLSGEINIIPKALNEFKFYIFTPEDTKNAYIMSGWLVKFIYEVRCNNDIDQFIKFANHSDNYKTINYRSEKEMFIDFNKYMLIKRIEQIIKKRFSERRLLVRPNILKGES